MQDAGCRMAGWQVAVFPEGIVACGDGFRGSCQCQHDDTVIIHVGNIADRGHDSIRALGAGCWQLMVSVSTERLLHRQRSSVLGLLCQLSAVWAVATVSAMLLCPSACVALSPSLVTRHGTLRRLSATHDKLLASFSQEQSPSMSSLAPLPQQPSAATATSVQAFREALRGQLVLAPLTRGGNLPFRRLCAGWVLSAVVCCRCVNVSDNCLIQILALISR
jgi:hypothetical protein